MVTTIKNKIDHLTDLIIAKCDNVENIDHFDGNIVTIHDDVKNELSVSEQSGSNTAKNPGSNTAKNPGSTLQTVEPSSDEQVTLINDSIVQLRHQSSSATSFAVKLQSLSKLIGHIRY